MMISSADSRSKWRLLYLTVCKMVNLRKFLRAMPINRKRSMFQRSSNMLI
jgi:hypothetical protein